VTESLDEFPEVAVTLTPGADVQFGTPAPVPGASRLPPLAIALGLGLCALAGGAVGVVGLGLALRRKR
jgi:hypothetical protein